MFVDNGKKKKVIKVIQKEEKKKLPANQAAMLKEMHEF